MNMSRVVVSEKENLHLSVCIDLVNLTMGMIKDEFWHYSNPWTHSILKYEIYFPKYITHSGSTLPNLQL